MGVLDEVIEYRILRAKRYLLRVPLDERQRVRLATLEDRYDVREDGDPRRRAPRFVILETGSFDAGGEVTYMTVRDASGGGLRLAWDAGARPTLRRGDVAYLGVPDRRRGAEHV